MNDHLIVAIIALFISIVDLFIILWDRRPHIKVNIDVEIFEDVTDDGPVMVGKRLWINVVNRSTHRVFITRISTEWSQYFFLPFRPRTVELDDLQMWENNKSEPTARFWIDPWGDAALSADAESIEFHLNEQLEKLGSRKGWYKVVVHGSGKFYRSNRIVLNLSRKRS